MLVDCGDGQRITVTFEVDDNALVRAAMLLAVLAYPEPQDFLQGGRTDLFRRALLSVAAREAKARGIIPALPIWCSRGRSMERQLSRGYRRLDVLVAAQTLFLMVMSDGREYRLPVALSKNLDRLEIDFPPWLAHLPKTGEKAALRLHLDAFGSGADNSDDTVKTVAKRTFRSRYLRVFHLFLHTYAAAIPYAEHAALHGNTIWRYLIFNPEWVEDALPASVRSAPYLISLARGRGIATAGIRMVDIRRADDCAIFAPSSHAL